MSNATGKNIKIDGGYILLSRRIIESEIWDKPPLYIKVWIYLLSRAQYKKYKGLDRGELWISIPEIQEACSWYVGFRKETPSKKQIFSILDWLRFPYEGVHDGNNKGTMKGSMIETTKATRGMVVKIVNYNEYQDPRNYEGNNEGNNEGDNDIPMKVLRRQQQGNRINKEGKEVRMNKNILSQETESLIISSWNSLGLSQVRVLKPDSERYKMLSARIKEHGLDKVIETIELVSKSDWLMGNKGDWKASLGWIVKPNNFIKVMEGNYTDRKEPSRGRQMTSDEMREKYGLKL